jgi:hypothetical protein
MELDEKRSYIGNKKTTDLSYLQKKNKALFYESENKAIIV